jgi:hypothetical protein
MCVTLPAPKTIRRIDRFGQIVVVRSLRSEGAGAFSGYALEKASVIAENRDSTADESKETHECLDTFDAVAADLERVQRLAATRARMNEPPSLRARPQFIDHGTAY